MTRWTSNFWPRIELEVPEGWSVEEYENCASFAPTDGSWVTVDVNAHEMPESDAVGVISILSRSPGLRLLDLGEVEVGGRTAWRFEADVIEDMTYNGVFGETADEGDRTVVHVVGVDDRVVAIHATAPGGVFPRYADDVAAIIGSLAFGDRRAE